MIRFACSSLLSLGFLVVFQFKFLERRIGSHLLPYLVACGVLLLLASILARRPLRRCSFELLRAAGLCAMVPPLAYLMAAFWFFGFFDVLVRHPGVFVVVVPFSWGLLQGWQLVLGTVVIHALLLYGSNREVAARNDPDA